MSSETQGQLVVLNPTKDILVSTLLLPAGP